MKKSKYLFIAISLFLLSCNSNPFKGKKYYMLNCKLNGYVATLEEIELNFISSDYVELKATLNSSLGEIRTYKNDSSLTKRIKTYKYNSVNSDGIEILEIPDLKISFRTTKQANGDQITSTNEVLYQKSIVEIINTSEAKERVKKASINDPLDNMYVKLLKPIRQERVNIPVIEEEQAVGFEGE